MDEGLESTTDEQELLDPDADTQVGELESDTDENTQRDTEPDVDWEARYRSLQSRWTRTQQELRQRENQLLELAGRQQQGYQEPEEPGNAGYLPPQVARELEELREYREQQEWEAAKAEYGEPVADAYAVFHEGWSNDPSPAGVYEAFLAAINVLAQAEVEQPAPRTRSQAVRPRVDTNAPDAPDRSQLDKQIEDAKAGRGKDPLASGIDAILKKAGLFS